MSDSTVIRNARLPGRVGRYQILVSAGHVQSIEPMTAAQERTQSTGLCMDDLGLDVDGDWISLGAVDLQINGALGLAFPDLRGADIGRLQTICERLWRQGVDGFCPTLVTTSLENFHGSLAAIQAFQQQQRQQPRPDSAKVLGVHLEGPFLNEVKRGAHPAKFLQPLTLERVKTVIGDYAETVSLMTLAPELEVQRDGDGGVIPWLTHQGIVVSLGHSLSSAEQARAAFKLGATMVTHAFNAMPGLHHRAPGLLGAALSDPRVFCGFIADGQHIGPTMLDLLLRLGQGSTDAYMAGLFLVSDALSPLGLPDGIYPWDTRQIEVVNGTARLADGTLAGTTLPLIEGAINLVRWGLCGVEDAIALVTRSPRQAIGLSELMPGSPAQLLRWHQSTPRELHWQRLILAVD